MSPHPRPHPHPHEPLDAFLGAWFHQDCCMHGETLHDIVAEYLAVTPDKDKRALQLDIAHFLRESSGDADADARLAAEFCLDIIPSEFATDGNGFLGTLYRLLGQT